MNFEDRVLQHEFKLNDTDDAIIDYIRSHRDSLSSISIQKIAAEVYTVPNAIMRLSRKLGYEGFSQLKVLINAENFGIVKTSTLFNQNITRTLELIDYDAYKDVAAKMHSAKTIHFIGVGDSLYACNTLASSLTCYGYKVGVYDTYNEIEYRLTHCDEKDLVVIVSASGQNEQINTFANKAKERGAFIVSFTHFYENPLAALVDIPMYFCGKDQKVNGYDVTDRTGLMIVLREYVELFWQMYCV